jgi:outer membrane receptor for ferrienterochelin and colicins
VFRRYLHSLLSAGALVVCLQSVAGSALAQPVEGPLNPCKTNNPGHLTGRVIDPSSSAVPAAQITVSCSGARHEIVTGANGRFSTGLPAGSHQLQITKDGFAPMTVAVEITAGKDIALEDIQLNLVTATEAVTVTAGGFEQLVREAPASVSVLPREELQQKRYASLAQALADVEGVDAQQDVGKTGGQTISMRGMPSDYTLMLIDGKRQNSPGSVTPNGFGETATSFMPPIGAIERIEVVRGPMSTLYGSDAMGGVVNVITRRVSQDWGGSVTLDGTAQGNRDYGDTANGNFYLSGPLWKRRIGLALRGGAFHRQAATLRYENVNGQPVPITAFGLSPTKSNVHNLGGRISYLATENNEFYFDFDGAKQIYDNRQRQLGTVGLQGGYAEEMRFNRQQYLFAHQGRYKLGILDTSLTRNTTSTDGRTIPPGTPGRTPGDPRTLEASNTVLDSKLITAIQKHTLSLGGQIWDAHMVDAVAPNPYNFKQSALFGEDEWRLHSKVAATLGTRYDYHNTFGGQLSPRAYLVYSPKPVMTLKGGISRGFRTPQLNQLATGIVGFGGQGTIPLIGSPGLKPETSTSAEFGGSWLVRGVNLSMTLFHNQFQNKIATGPGL